jgi:hypothetical protein
MFADKIKDMTQNPFLVYSREHKCIVDVKLKLYAFLCDRPDKSKRLEMLAGGNSHACWLYCGEYYDAIDQAVLCACCFSKLLMNDDIGSKAPTPCGVCYSLDFKLMKFKPHEENFPIEMIPPGTSLLPFNRIQAIRDSEVRATVFFTNKKHALNTLKMPHVLRSDVMQPNRVSGHFEVVRLVKQ